MSLLYAYASRLLSETMPDTLEVASASTSELLDLLRYMRLKQFDSGDVASVQAIVNELKSHRSARLASLRNVYPSIHWLVLSVLSTSVIFCFLIQTDQDALRFLDDVQTRTLFALLTCSMSLTGLLCADLLNPFSGFFTVFAYNENQFLSFLGELEAEIRDIRSEQEMMLNAKKSNSTRTSSSSNTDWF